MDNKENMYCAEKKSRVRGENWSQEEKDMFIEIMRDSASIIENKQTDTNTNKKKNLEWVKIQNKLKELSGVHRDILQLKGLWRRTKLAAKKTVSEHRRAVRGTGGGQQPPSPSQKDLTIMDLCPMDFVEEENKFDSDAVSPFTSQDDVEKVHNSTVIYDIDLNEDIENEPEISFIEEIITVQDIHNNEVQIKPANNTTTEIKPKDTTVIKPKEMGTHTKKIKKNKPQVNTSKAAVIEVNKEIKQRAVALMEEEYALKLKFQRQEIAHQQLRQKLEIEILILEKEKKLLEIELIKKKTLTIAIDFYLQNHIFIHNKTRCIENKY